MRNAQSVALADESASVPLRLDLGEIRQPNLDACARVFAKLAVDKALKELGLTPLPDSGPTRRDDVGNPHKAAPPGVRAPNGAKEQVT